MLRLTLMLLSLLSFVTLAFAREQDMLQIGSGCLLLRLHSKENHTDYHLNVTSPQGGKPFEPRFKEARFHRLLDALLAGYDVHVRPVVRVSALA